MHSTNVRQIKAALVEQAFHGTTQVSCPMGPVVAVSKWKGQLRVMIRGWPRWYSVESVRIEGTGVAFLQEQGFLLSPGGVLAPLLPTDRTRAVHQEEYAAPHLEDSPIVAQRRPVEEILGSYNR